MFSEGETIHNEETSLTITTVHPIKGDRTVRMYDVLYSDGTTERLSESELKEFEQGNTHQ
jgi:hypothetical protein